jgi:hypothetical protein
MPLAVAISTTGLDPEQDILLQLCLVAETENIITRQISIFIRPDVTNTDLEEIEDKLEASNNREAILESSGIKIAKQAKLTLEELIDTGIGIKAAHRIFSGLVSRFGFPLLLVNEWVKEFLQAKQFSIPSEVVYVNSAIVERYGQTFQKVPLHRKVEVLLEDKDLSYKIATGDCLSKAHALLKLFSLVSK